MTFLNRQSLGIWFLSLVALVFPYHAAQFTRGYSHVAWDAQGRYFTISGPISPEILGFILYDAQGIEQGRYAVPMNVLDMAWSPVAQQLAVYTVADEGMTEVIQIWDMERREIALEIKKGDNDFETADMRPHWSPDGSSIAIVYGREVRIWDAVTRNLKQLISIDDKWLGFIAWGEDSKSVQLHDESGIAYTYDIEAERVITETRISDTPLLNFRHGPTGTTLAVIEQGRIEIRDRNSGEVSTVIPLEPRTQYSYASWDTTGAYFVLMRATGDIEFWNVVSGQREYTVSSFLTGYAEAFAISPDGQSMVVVSGPTVMEATPEAVSSASEIITPLVPGFAVLIDLSQFGD
jgi:Tol biopolymer transport system component